MANNILITGCVIVPMDDGTPDYFDGSVGITGNRITMVTAERSRVNEFRARHGSDLETIDGHGKVVMPGLINTHCHAPMTLMRGYADDIPLMRWLHDKVWPFESRITRDDVKLGARLGIAEMLLGGTTSFVDMYWMEEAVAEAVVESGIRAVLATTVIDSNFDAFAADLEQIVALSLSPASEGRIEAMAAPHAPYSCSEETIRKTIALCDKYGVGILTHVSETRDEMEIIASRTGKTPVELLDGLGFFDRRSIAVHGVYLTDGDIAVLQQKGVSLSHNPESNMKLASGIAPVAKAMAAGVNVALGTDGTCSNNDLDMWGEMRSASLLQKVATGDPCVVPAREMLRMATVNGARAIGRESDLGRIREGMLADIIVIDIEKPHHYPRHDIVANLAYCGKASDVDTVIVNGRIVARHGKTTGQNINEIFQQIDFRAHSLARE